MISIHQQTAYPEINAALGTMHDAISVVLGSGLAGFYVYGSLALGDFDPEKSDIDAVVVTEGDLDQGTIQALKDMHEALFETGSKWVREIELCYIPQDAMKKYDGAHPPRPRLIRGEFKPVWQGDDWVLHRHVLREHGIVVSGPPAASMIDPVSAEDIRQAVAVGILQNWWEDRVLQDPDRLRDDDMYQAYATLTMCRALFTLETGEIASKKQSALWALGVLDEPFRNLVGRAASWTTGVIMDDYQGAVDFIRYALKVSRAAGYQNMPRQLMTGQPH